ATGLGSTTSAAFIVNPAAVSKLAFSVPPSTTTAGSVISPAVQVQVLDPFGNLVTTDNTDQVIVGVATGPGLLTAASTTSMTVSGGLTTFNNLVLDTAGTYTLSAKISGLYSVTSTAFG